MLVIRRLRAQVCGRGREASVDDAAAAAVLDELGASGAPGRVRLAAVA